MSEKFQLYFVHSGVRFAVEDEITAGVSRYCELNLAEYFSGNLRTISFRHFKIYKTDKGFIIKDLTSQNGTQINDEPLPANTPRILRNRDVIKLAKNDNFKIEVMLDGTAVADENQPTLYLDEANSLFFIGDLPIHNLSEIEYELMKCLYEKAERVCSYFDISKKVWHGSASDDTIRSTVKNIRKKLKEVSPEAGGKRYIKTSRGYVRGYMLTRN